MFGEANLGEIEAYVKGKHPDVKLLSLIVKANDDVRQEMFSSQVIYLFKTILVQADVNIWLREFAVIPTCSNGGLIETISDAISIDRLKKM